jgi:broad specificity phosphatase PhoE
MSTTKIMVIRHAERPNGESGAMPDGQPNVEALTPTGWLRAQALAGFFATPDGRFATPDLATPQTMFASGIGHHSTSLRPQQTVTPLASSLGLAPVTTWLKGQEPELAQAAASIGGVVLIAWEHERIPSIVAALPQPPGVPKKWPGDRFDVVWIFDRLANSWRFSQQPQMLLPGDQPTVIQ